MNNKIINIKDILKFQDYRNVELESLDELVEIVGEDTIIGKLTVDRNLNDATTKFLEELEDYTRDNLSEELSEKYNEAGIDVEDIDLSTIEIPRSVKEYQSYYYFPLKQEFKGLYFVESTKPDYTSDLERLSKTIIKLLDNEVKANEEESLTLAAEQAEKQKELQKFTEDYKAEYQDATSATQKKTVVKEFKILAESKFGKIFPNETVAELILSGKMGM